MRNGVVSVDDVEVELAGDLDDASGKRDEVLRFAKQRIRGGVDAVEAQARLVIAEPERRIGI